MSLLGFASTLAGCLARFLRALGSMFGAVAPVQGCFPPTSACSFHPSACFARSLGLAAPRFLSVGFLRRFFSLSFLSLHETRPSAVHFIKFSACLNKFLSVGFHRRLFSPSLLVSFLLTLRLLFSFRLTAPNFLSVGFPTVK